MTNPISIKRYCWYDKYDLLEVVYYFYDKEYEKYLKKDFPIKNTEGKVLWLDDNNFIHRDNNLPSYISDGENRYYVHGKLHRTDGQAIFDEERSDNVTYYYLNGVRYDKKEWFNSSKRKTYFFAQKIKTLQKLLEIPEIWDEVYYTHKEKFISLLSKI